MQEYENITSEYVDEVELNSSYPYFHYYVNKAEDAEALPKTLIFQGSYYNRGPQFFVRATNEYIGVHNYQNVLNIDYYFNIFLPEVVIFDVAEYTLTNTYFNLAKMKELDLNPAIITADEPIDEQIEQLMRDAELFEVDASLSLLPGDQVDKVLIGRRFSDAKYGYLIAQDKVFDLKKDSEGLYYASIPHGTLMENDEVLLYIEEYDGKKIYVPITVQTMELLTEQLSGSAGADFKDGGVYELTTEVEDNQISSVVLQLYDAQTNEYIGPLCSTTAAGAMEGMYNHEADGGWYRLCLKINTNLADEYISCIVYLEHGEAYFYSFNLDALSEKTAEISEFEFYGHNATQSLVEDLKCSAGAEQTGDGGYIFSTDAEGNLFHSIVLQIYDADSKEPLPAVCTASGTGVSQGVYTHEAEGGWYIVRLRANSNLKDEYVEQEVFLEKGNVYGYAFHTVQLSDQSAEIDGFVFQCQGEP